MRKKKWQWKSKVWIYPGDVAWHFMTVPKAESAEISKIYTGMSKGWGSLPVCVTVGTSTWQTSIFPDRKSGTFLLPLKALIRKKEGLFIDDVVSVSIRIRV